MIVCPRCGRENEPDNKYCGRCGLEFAQVVASSPQSEGDVVYCYRHKKEPTKLSCGRCERPICHRCAIIGPAGPRCRDCARHSVPIRPRAVVGSAKMGLTRVARLGPFAIYWWLLIVVMVVGLFRGCASEPAASPPQGDMTRE